MLSACTPTLVHLPVPFDAKEAQSLLRPGTNQISGTIKFEPDKGHVLAYPDTFVTCEGQDVILIPYTDYAREWALKYYGKPVTDIAYKLTHRAKAQTFDNYDAFMASTRKTQCDENGNFQFNDVANGNFFVMANVQWKGKDEEVYKFAFAPEDIDEEDGTVVKKITLKDSQNLKLNGPWP